MQCANVQSCLQLLWDKEKKKLPWITSSSWSICSCVAKSACQILPIMRAASLNMQQQSKQHVYINNWPCAYGLVKMEMQDLQLVIREYCCSSCWLWWIIKGCIIWSPEKPRFSDSLLLQQMLIFVLCGWNKKLPRQNKWQLRLHLEIITRA